MIVNPYRFATGGSPPAASYWSPTLKDASITLSAADSIANYSAAAFRAVKSVTSHTTGKRYAEMKRTSTLSWSEVMGVGNSSAPTNNFVGADANGWGLQIGDGPGANLLRSGAAVGASISEIVNGSYARIAIDFDAGKGWLGNSTQWHGGGDPAAGTTPSFTFTANTEMWLMGSAYRNSDEVITLRTATADFVGTVPTGFGEWA